MMMAPIDRFPKPRPLPQPIDPTLRDLKQFIKADKNQDGVLTKDEFVGNRRKPFGHYDKNNDGKITIQEYLAGSKGRPIWELPRPPITKPPIDIKPWPLPGPGKPPVDVEPLPVPMPDKPVQLPMPWPGKPPISIDRPRPELPPAPGKPVQLPIDISKEIDRIKGQAEEAIGQVKPQAQELAKSAQTLLASFQRLFGK